MMRTNSQELSGGYASLSKCMEILHTYLLTFYGILVVVFHALFKYYNTSRSLGIKSRKMKPSKFLQGNFYSSVI